MFHHHKAHTKFIPVLTSGHIVNTATYFEHLFRLKTFEHLCTLKTLKCNSYIRANIKDYEKNGCFLISTQKICHALYLQGLDQNNNGVLLTYVCWGAQSSVSNLDSFQKRLHHHVSNEIFVGLNPYPTDETFSQSSLLLIITLGCYKELHSIVLPAETIVARSRFSTFKQSNVNVYCSLYLQLLWIVSVIVKNWVLSVLQTRFFCLYTGRFL